MNPFTSYYGARSCSSNGENYFEDLDAGDSVSGRKLTAEEKAIAANKSHSEAERRRRRRINGHLNTLRSILPDLIKTDKASLLAEVVRRVRELKATAAAAEMGLRECHDDVASSGRGSTKEWVLPGETDEVSLGYCEEEPSLIKAILCCEDRPELMRDVIRAVKSVKVRVVRAEMATIGGRTKCVIWVTGLGRSGEGITTLRRALKVVVDRPGLSGGYGQGLSGNKRTRFSHLSLPPSFPVAGR
ncbi:Myc-type, basic helix-loop-helix (bHLH) domain [Dillenia turbinata]|uniref:Myc-type, basic helix-loop-helix (BHLH) domain n=1 Tax=Dillenia turbinata TaxID=194707 RepID=A0AAN8V5B3_9MAGN